MRTALCPGSFDPVTCGHIDVIRRAAKLFDRVIVVVMINYHKPNSCFTAEERVEMLRRSLAADENVEVDMYGGLLADYAKQKDACAVVKGLRAVSDFEYEFQQALTNKNSTPSLRRCFSPPMRRICICHRALSSRCANSAEISVNLCPPRSMTAL